MKGKKKGFTLVELMIVVVILGILAAIAIPLYMKFVQSSKAGEARLNLGKIASLLERYYDSRGNQSTTIAVATGTSTTMIPSFPLNAEGGCAVATSGTSRVPTDPTMIANKKYTPAESDWGGPWAEIPFAITQPIAYQYCYDGSGTSNSSKFTVGAFGDLDADTVYSSFRRAGAILCTGTTSCAVSVGSIVVTNESE